MEIKDVFSLKIRDIISLIISLPITINEEKNCDRGAIRIGDHVWVAAHSHILKNSSIPDGSVVAYHSLVTKEFDGERLLLGGCPAKVLEEQIEWER